MKFVGPLCAAANAALLGLILVTSLRMSPHMTPWGVAILGMLTATALAAVVAPRVQMQLGLLGSVAIGSLFLGALSMSWIGLALIGTAIVAVVSIAVTARSLLLSPATWTPIGIGAAAGFAVMSVLLTIAAMFSSPPPP